MYVLGGAALALGGATLLYLASPHQRLVTQAGPPRRNAAFGALALLIAQVLLLQRLGPATAVFTLLTLLMAALTGLPFLGAVVRAPRERR